jgi:hypothetical protein
MSAYIGAVPAWKVSQLLSREKFRDGVVSGSGGVIGVDFVISIG